MITSANHPAMDGQHAISHPMVFDLRSVVAAWSDKWANTGMHDVPHGNASPA